MRVDDLYFSVGDMEYWYEVHGEGIPIVLLHGFTGSSSTWQRFVRACPSGFKLVTVDLPGHGRTSGEQIKSMDACISDLQQLFKSLQLEQFILVGYSMGGRTALSYAIKYPENVAGLVLESASPGLFDAAAREERKNKDEQLALRIEKEGITAFVDYWENIPLFQTQKQLSKGISVSNSERTDRANSHWSCEFLTWDGYRQPSFQLGCFNRGEDTCPAIGWRAGQQICRN